MMRRILMMFLCCLLLAGCGRIENPWQVDTVVRIPVDPTVAAADAPALPEETAPLAETEEPTEETELTEAPEEIRTTEATEEKTGTAAKKPASAKKPTSTKQPSSGGSKEPSKATEPESTEVPETEQPTEAAETEAPPFNPSDYSAGSLEKEILREMNRYRTEAGLGELSMSKMLCGIAALRAEEAVELWSHTRPDGRSFTTAMIDYGFGFGSSAENLVHVTGSGDGAAIVAKWMDTEIAENILNELFTTAGIGIYRTGGETVAACLLVG